MRGQIGANLWAWEGDPNLADIDALNVPKGALVIDTTTPALYIKTTPRGTTNTAGYSLTPAGAFQPLDAQLTALAAFTAQQVTNLGVASGTKIYRALLTQTGTDAPVATVLENTLGGTVVWAYATPGNYLGTLTGAFPSGKVLALATGGTSGFQVACCRSTSNVIQFTTYDLATDSNADSLLVTAASLSIIVYP